MRPQEAVERALSLSTTTDCVVIAEESSDANLRWAGNTLTTNGVGRSRRLTVVAIQDGAVGVVSRAGAGRDDVAQIVKDAEEIARAGEPAEDAAPLVTGTHGDWDAEPAVTDISVFSAFAPALGEQFARAEEGGNRLYGFAHHEMSSVFVGSSAGLRARHDQPTGKLELNAKNTGSSAWVGAGTRDFADLDVPALGAELGRRLAWGERRVELPAGRYETLLPPSSVSDLMIYLYWTAGARDAHDGRTVFSSHPTGTELSKLPLRLYSDPSAPGLECTPFVTALASGSNSSVFDNGLPLGPTDWIKDGKVAALTSTRYSAGLTGAQVTPEIDNLLMEGAPGGASLEEMVARTERGLLLTCLWYIREVDPQNLLLTGLTRDGVYLVEGGEVVAEVNNFRFNESPVGLLSRVTETGAAVPTLPREWSDYFTRASMPPLRVADYNMSTVSKAS
ncbi:metallopeptidase TldD-related protein [Actinocorallia sp. A-T 12471]|uniref:metallopeptidase TldD-related protein n=1 Tax=Actinocorallia sp. A-T 12471 TaxID=3089813 RepID=UPI0029CFF8A2|nr:metallopeptidase TldD-related protein [Actinocorallia sp. A-T 12471]MDX6744324.1 metallopeptidase TldD-related protein [Actinocorallia sp. A-T 12471]